MEDFKKFMSQYGGMIIGAIVAVILMATQLYKLIIGIIKKIVLSKPRNIILSLSCRNIVMAAIWG